MIIIIFSSSGSMNIVTTARAAEQVRGESRVGNCGALGVEPGLLLPLLLPLLLLLLLLWERLEAEEGGKGMEGRRGQVSEGVVVGLGGFVGQEGGHCVRQ